MKLPRIDIKPANIGPFPSRQQRNNMKGIISAFFRADHPDNDVTALLGLADGDRKALAAAISVYILLRMARDIPVNGQQTPLQGYVTVFSNFFFQACKKHNLTGNRLGELWLSSGENANNLLDMILTLEPDAADAVIGYV